MRRAFDHYPTPVSIVQALAHHVSWGPCTYWEPCNGDGALSSVLDSAGYMSIRSDVQNGRDFFDFKGPLDETIITNPPFKLIRQFIDRAFELGVRRMALVCPERLWACQKGREQFLRHRPSQFINMDWREDYLGRGGSPDRALAVSIWDRPCSRTCEFDVWTKVSGKSSYAPLSEVQLLSMKERQRNREEGDDHGETGTAGGEAGETADTFAGSAGRDQGGC